MAHWGLPRPLHGKEAAPIMPVPWQDQVEDTQEKSEITSVESMGVFEHPSTDGSSHRTNQAIGPQKSFHRRGEEPGLDKIKTFRDRSLNFSKLSVKVRKL